MPVKHWVACVITRCIQSRVARGKCTIDVLCAIVHNLIKMSDIIFHGVVVFGMTTAMLRAGFRQCGAIVSQKKLRTKIDVSLSPTTMRCSNSATASSYVWCLEHRDMFVYMPPPRFKESFELVDYGVGFVRV